MSNVVITELAPAQVLTGLEAVPIVQNGKTVQTTTGAIANSPVLNQTFLTVGAQPVLGNSRAFTAGAGLTTVDSGPASLFSVNMVGAPLSLVTSPNGFQVKTSTNILTSRAVTVGSGLAVSNGDGIAGNPLIAYSGVMSNLAALSGTGLVVVNGTTATQVAIVGTPNQATVVNGNGIGSPTVGLADNVVLPGNSSVTLPIGTTAQRIGGAIGQLRFNLDIDTYEAYQAGVWRQFSLTGNVTTFSAGSTGLTPSTATAGAVILGGTLVVPNGGTGATSLSGYLFGNGTLAVSASANIPNTAITGLGTLSTQNANAVAITGGTINNTVIGATIEAIGKFSTLTATTGIFGGTF